jgi:DNA-directed RNA polymerase specialized sigma24 family protein
MIRELMMSQTSPFVLRYFTENEKLIQSIIRNYCFLDTAIDGQDLKQEAFVAIQIAFRTWNQKRARHMKFPSYLYWIVRRHFQGKFPGKDKVVDIMNGEGRVIRTITYAEWLKERGKLKSDGLTTSTRSILVSYEHQFTDPGELLLTFCSPHESTLTPEDDRHAENVA